MKITSPTLLIDKAQCLKNIDKISSKFKKKGIKFRPHFKTHISAEIGEWFRDYGVTSITVSSLKMAHYFADHGWNDITIAFPINILELDKIDELSKKITLNIVIEEHSTILACIEQLKNPINIYIKIDTGAHRTGINASKELRIKRLIEAMHQKKELTKFKGFLTHAGNTYHAHSKNSIFAIHFDSLLKLKKLKATFRHMYPDLEISIGDTPSATLCENFDGVDEVRPGNFIFYDAMQWQLGVCTLSEIAIRMVCPIVAKHKSRNEIVIHGGAVHFSKESITNIDGKPLFGYILDPDSAKHNCIGILNEKNYLHILSQEHGIIKATPFEFPNFKTGKLVEIIPVHSCLTVSAMRHMMTTDGEKIETMLS